MNKNNYNFRQNNSLPELILILFLIFVVILSFSSDKPYLYVYTIIIFYLIILFSELLFEDNKIYFFYSLFFLIICVILLLSKTNFLVQNFANYVFAFLFIGVASIFLDSLIKKLKGKKKFVIYKFILFFLFSLLSVVTIFFYFNDFLVSFKNIQLSVLKRTNEQKYFSEYYKNIDRIFLKGRFIDNDTQLDIIFPNEKLQIVDSIYMYIEGRIIISDYSESFEIKEIGLWLDGEPGKGRYLGNANFVIDTNTDNTDLDFDNKEYYVFNIDIKLDNIEDGAHKLHIYAQSELFGWEQEVIDFEFRNYANDEKIKEAELNKDNVKIFIDKPNQNQKVEETFKIEGWTLDLNSPVYSHYSGIDRIEIYLDGKPGEGELLYEGKLNKERSDLVEVFGSQFINSGYLYEADLGKIEKGRHTIFVFAHSVYSGWESESVVFVFE